MTAGSRAIPVGPGSTGVPDPGDRIDLLRLPGVRADQLAIAEGDRKCQVVVGVEDLRRGPFLAVDAEGPRGPQPRRVEEVVLLPSGRGTGCGGRAAASGEPSPIRPSPRPL